MTDEKILEVEKFANEMIHQNIIVSTEVILQPIWPLNVIKLFLSK